MNSKRIILLISATSILGGLAFFGRLAMSQAAGRLGIQCAPVDGTQRTSFVCSLLSSAGADVFLQDTYGGVVQLQGAGDPSQTIQVSNASVGPSGRGGAREVNGNVEVVDEAGRVSYQNFVPQSLLPFAPEASSVGIFGNTQGSPLSLNLVSPVSGVTSGVAVFVGDSDNISINVSGRNGANGRSAGVAAAFEVLEGALGQSASVTSLVNDMGLGPALSEPSLTLNQLSSSVGVCEQIPGGLLKTPSANSDGISATATTTKAENLLVQRNSCQRQTSDEFSIQTECSREAELTSALRCGYPNIEQDAPVWRRSPFSQVVSISCSESVPYGTWNTTCNEESFAVAGSVIRPEYITLAPSKYIMEGMMRPLYHHLTPSSNSCSSDPAGGRWADNFFNNTASFISSGAQDLNQQNDPYFYYVTSPEYHLHSFTRNFSGSVSTNDQVETACDGFTPMNKMDKLQTTGALIYRYNRNELPGTAAEQADGTEADITKLTYWMNRAQGAPTQVPPVHRVPYDDLTGAKAEDGTLIEAVDSQALAADQPFDFADLDPATATADGLTAVASNRSAYWSGLNALGFTTPDINNALVSYASLSEKREYTTADTYSDPTSANPSGSQGTTTSGMLKDILCNMASAYVEQSQSCSASQANCSAASMCDKILSDFNKNSGNTLATNYRFREMITYSFSGLRAGVMMVNTPGSDPTTGQPTGVTSYVRSLPDRDVQFKPRAIFIPGDLTVTPITKVSYCNSINIDSTDDTLIETGSPMDFIGPEALGGSGFNVYGAILTSYPALNTSATPADISGLNHTGGGNHAPNITVYPWANSFMRVKTIGPNTQLGPFNSSSYQSGCSPVEIDHNLTAQEQSIIKGFKSLNGVLVTAQGTNITVYFSPVTVPHDTKTLVVKESLSPGLFLPRVNVSPMNLLVDSGLYDSNIWAGSGAPTRSPDLGGLGNDPWTNSFTNVNASLHAQFNLGINYYALPGDTGTPNPNSDSSYPFRSFTAAGTRTLSGALPSGESDPGVRGAEGQQTTGAPRFIKSLMTLDLAVNSSNPQESTTTVNKTNVRAYGNVLLSTKLGGKTTDGSSPSATCLTNNLISTLKYPTKLISRRAAPKTGNTTNLNLPFGQDGDMNVVVDDEVSSSAGPTNNWLPNNLYFTRAYIPTTMRTPGVGSLEEPINLAQDYNSFLAQIQTNATIARDGTPPNTPAGTAPTPGLLSLNIDGGKPYDRTLTLKGVLANLRMIGDRAPNQDVYDPAGTSYPNINQEWWGVQGQWSQSNAEYACFNTPFPAGYPGSGGPAPYCFDYSVGGIYRSNQVPFSVLAAGGTSSDTEFGLQYNANVIANTTVPLFRGVRPFDQYFQPNGSSDAFFNDWDFLQPNTVQVAVFRYQFQENSQNIDCDSDPQSWITREECSQNFNYFTGQFFPFLRTKRWIFWGDHSNGGTSSNIDYGNSAVTDILYINGDQPAKDSNGNTLTIKIPSKVAPPASRKIPDPNGDTTTSSGLPLNVTESLYATSTQANDIIGGAAPNNLGLFFGGNDTGGADFNPGGLFLPPFGVSGQALHFTRLMSMYNRNCGDIRDEVDTKDPLQQTSGFINTSLLTAGQLASILNNNKNNPLNYPFNSDRKAAADQDLSTISSLNQILQDEQPVQGLVGIASNLGQTLGLYTNDYCFDQGGEVHRFEAAFHIFQGSGADLDIFANGGAGYPTGGGEDQADHQAPGDAQLTNEPELRWIGTSGYVFNDCSDNLSASDTIVPVVQTTGGAVDNHLVSLNNSPFSMGFFPTGLSVADEGGLYFGPLIGSNLQPYLGSSPSGIDEPGYGYNSYPSSPSSYFSNALIILPGQHIPGSGVPIYNALDSSMTPTYLAGQIIQNDFGSYSGSPASNNGSSFPIMRGVAARMATVGRILEDANSDLQNTNGVATFDYEPPFTLEPEVLAAFFLHSDFGDGAQIANGENLNPYSGSGPQSRPFYFEQILGSFLTAGQKTAITNYGFTKNAFAVDGNYVRPMIFTFEYLNPTITSATGQISPFPNISDSPPAASPTAPYSSWQINPSNSSSYYLPPPIRFAWSLDSLSLNFSVINMNVANGPDGTVSGLASGVAVSYAPNGGEVFGQMTDTYPVTRGTISDTALRSNGLDDSLVRDTKLVLNKYIGPQGTNVTYYVDPNVQEVGPRPWAFAENYCGVNRKNYLQSYTSVYGDHLALLNSAQGLANPMFGPYDATCVLAAIAIAPTLDNATNTTSSSSTIGAANQNGISASIATPTDGGQSGITASGLHSFLSTLTTTNGNSTAYVTSTSGITSGDSVACSSCGIAPNTTITAVGTNSITLSNPATASGTFIVSINTNSFLSSTSSIVSNVGPILVGTLYENSLLHVAQSTNQSNSLAVANHVTSEDVTLNLYWQFVKADIGTTLPPTSHDPNNPPSCPTGVLQSEVFQVTGNAPNSTYSALNGWQATDGSVAVGAASGNPTCPVSVNGNPQLQVGAVYATLYSDPSLCYGQATGAAIPDLRSLSGSGQQVSVCPVPSSGFCSLPGITSEAVCLAQGGTMQPATADTFNATTVEGLPASFFQQGSVPNITYPQPTGALSPYGIFSGTRVKTVLSMAAIDPLALLVTPGTGDTSFEDIPNTTPPTPPVFWLPDNGQTVSASCPVVPYDPETGIDASADPEGKPILAANWSYLEVDRRFGALDPYYVMTTAKQTIITSFSDAGTAATIADAADTCNWSAGVGQPGGPVNATPLLKTGAAAAPSALQPTSYLDFTYAVGYDWLAGASSTVTTQQSTPWSSERNDGVLSTAPDCSIFNDSTTIARENDFPITAATLGPNNLFSIGTPPTDTTYLLNPKGAPDSSLNNSVQNFATGGYWTSIGVEQLQLNAANSTIPVNCQIFLNPANGTDNCNANITITYQTVNGYQLSTQAENGEPGGNAGQAVVLTTFQPSQINITSGPGSGGLAGGTTLSGTAALENLVCYEPGTNPLNPSMKIYRFNNSVISVAPGQNGNPGQNSGQSFFGWGIMPEANSWLSNAVISSVSQNASSTSPAASPAPAPSPSP